MVVIQDGKLFDSVEDWLKLSDIQILLQVYVDSVSNGTHVFDFLVMTAFQDSQQYVKVEDWPKVNGVWFLLQVLLLTLKVTMGIFVISGNCWQPRWLTRWYLIKDGQQKIICSQTRFFLKFSKFSDVFLFYVTLTSCGFNFTLHEIQLFTLHRNNSKIFEKKSLNK